LAISPREAARLLSISLGHIYLLMAHGELGSFQTRRSRRIPVQALHDYVARRLAAAKVGPRLASRNYKQRRDGDGKGQNPAAALAQTIRKRGVAQLNALSKFAESKQLSFLAGPNDGLGAPAILRDTAEGES
jgi:excisionase family DNA binding protein